MVCISQIESASTYYRSSLTILQFLAYFFSVKPSFNAYTVYTYTEEEKEIDVFKVYKYIIKHGGTLINATMQIENKAELHIYQSPPLFFRCLLNSGDLSQHSKV